MISSHQIYTQLPGFTGAISEHEVKDLKPKLPELAQRYVTALRKHLKDGPRASLRPALKLGCQGLALGLKTLGLARIHELALMELKVSPGKSGDFQRATDFFSEAATPIDETLPAGRLARSRLDRLKRSLDLRSKELAATNRQMEKGVRRGKVLAKDFEKRGKVHERRMRESLQLQDRLRHLTHRVLAAQEQERKSISLQLQDEIAQTLLSIQVRLMNLKAAARGNTSNLTKEIASTQKLVIQSVRSINRFARELGLHHEV
jgi:signal transduction histidine kinase